MTFISLTATDSNYKTYYKTNGIVSKQNYDHSHLFIRYEHTPTSDLSPEIIYIYETYKYGYGIDKKLTLNEGKGIYKKIAVTKAHVYYNAYDIEVKNPLLFVIFFKGDESNNKYYKRSNFQSEINRKDSKLISDLNPFVNEKEILDDLISENDRITYPLTYNVGKTTNNVEGELYINGKIKIFNSIQSKLTQNGFIKYEHIPQTGHNYIKSCVRYGNNALLDWKGNKTEKIEQVQGQKLKTLIVYFSNKSKN